MDSYSWIQDRRKSIGISQDELAERLHSYGFDVTRATISHWEKGRYRPPFDDPMFTKALASSLEMDIRSVLVSIGYRLAVEGSDAASRAASMIDQMSPGRQQTALVLLEQLLKEG